MTEVVIRNKDMLEVLNGFSEEMLSKLVVQRRKVLDLSREKGY